MNLYQAVNKLIELNNQGVSAHLEELMPGVQIRLNNDYPTTAPLELWATKLDDPSKWQYLGVWSVSISEWQSNDWQVKYDN